MKNLKAVVVAGSFPLFACSGSSSQVVEPPHSDASTVDVAQDGSFQDTFPDTPDALGDSGARDTGPTEECAAHWGGKGLETCTECGCGERNWSCAISTCMSPAGTVRKLGFEAGFIGLDAYDYWASDYGHGLRDTGRMAPTRLFYAFQPADDKPAQRPLLVFFNGGPGGATTNVLFSFNTAKVSLDTPNNTEPPWKDNPHSFTRVANLLYIDTRATGFSYGLAPSGNEKSVAANPWVDAGDVLHVILRFLDTHEPLTSNPVVLVGESWGGGRAQLILQQVQHYEEMRSNDWGYNDVSLSDAIEKHFERIHPELAGTVIPAETIVAQFGWQVLIQPAILGKTQLDATHKVQCPGRPDPDPDLRIERATSQLSRLDVLRKMLGVDPVDVRYFHASERAEATREHCPTQPWNSWNETFGNLGPSDCYFAPIVLADFDPWGWASVPAAWGRNLDTTKTLLTNATLDNIVCSAALRQALHDIGIFREISVQSDSPGSRGANLILRPNEAGIRFGLEPGDKVLRYPSYKAHHSVPMHTPDEFFQDVSQWTEFPTVPSTGSN